MAQYRKPSQRFVPRRDLFPDTRLSLSTRPSSQQSSEQSRQEPKRQDTPAPSPTVHKKEPETRKINSLSIPKIQPLPLFFFLFAWRMIGPRLSSTQKKNMPSIQSTIHSVLNEPNTIDMLTAVSPYLSEKEQESVYSIIGVMEALNTIKAVKERTYQKQQARALSIGPMDIKARKIGILKAMRPYVSADFHPAIDKLLSTYEVSDRLVKNMKIYRNNRELSSENETNPIDRVNELIQVFKPLVPAEHQEKVNQIVRVMKMAQAMDLGKKASAAQQKDEAAEVQSTESASEEKTQKSQPELVGTMAEEAKKESQPNPQANAAANMINSLQSMMNDDQKRSMETIIKMAQLLSQPSSESESGKEAESKNDPE